MRRRTTGFPRFLPLLLVPVFAAAALHAQSGAGIAVTEIIDNRISDELLTGTLHVQVKLTGSNLDPVQAARVVVKEATDDLGTNLLEESKPDFRARDVNNGTLELSLKPPPRAASTLHVKGTIEMFVPSRDPLSVVKVPNALAKLDVPLAAKALRTANLRVTPLSASGYAAEREKQKVTPKDIEEMRKEARARGASEKEIEFVAGLAEAMGAMDEGPAPDGAVILSGAEKDFARIFLVDVLGSDGKPVDMTSRSSSTHGDSVLMVLQPSKPLPDNATLQFTLLTDKSRVTAPFELKKVALP